MKKTNRVFSRVTALLLVLMMLSALTLTVFAADGDAPALNPIIPADKTTGDLTIHKYVGAVSETAGTGESGEDPGEGYTPLNEAQFSIVKIADLVTYQDDSDNTIELVYAEVGTLITDLLDVEPIATVGDVKYFRSNDLQAALNTLVGSDKSAVEEYVLDKAGTDGSKTTSDGIAAFTGKPIGLYLVAETTVPHNIVSSTNPFLVSLPMTDINGTDAEQTWNYDVHVYPKNQEANSSLDKLVRVDKADFKEYQNASMGDKLTYRLIAKVPEIGTATTYLTEFKFEDTLPDGITYVLAKKEQADSEDPEENEDEVPAVVIYFYSTEAAAKTKETTSAKKTWNATDDTPMFTVVYADGKMTVELTEDGLAALNKETGNEYDKTWMVVEYQGTVNSDSTVVLGDKGNVNEATLSYKRTNTDSEMVYTDAAVVYSYGIDLTKTMKGGAQNEATNVVFTLKNNTESDNLKFTKITVSGKDVYCVDPNGALTTVSPDANGNLQIRGLEADVYTLTETKTKAGYILLKDPIEIAIYETKAKAIVTTEDGSEPVITVDTIASAKVDAKDATMDTLNGSLHALVELEVVNPKGFELPKTGGSGLWMITVAGVLGFAGGFAMLKKGKEE